MRNNVRNSTACAAHVLWSMQQVFAVLQILDRGTFFDDIEGLTGNSEATACVTLHNFCGRFATELYDEHIHLPTGAAHEETMSHYHKLGFSGAIGSTDVTHLK